MKRLETNIVEPAGPLDAKICFVGEAPGEEEDLALQPFIGTAGQFFNRVLAKKQIIRGEVLLTNVFRQRPPRNNVGYFYQDSGPLQRRKLTWEGEEHVEALRRWLQFLKDKGGPNVLVALGVEPLKHLTGKRRISKWRGSVLPCTLVPGFKVYPTFHPSYVNRLLNEPKEKLQGEKKQDAQNVLPLFEIDFDRIIIQSESPDFSLPERNFEISLTHQEIINELKMIYQNHSRVSVDIETFQGEEGPVIWCIGFATSPAYAFTIPILRRQQFAWSADEEAEIWYWVSKIFLAEGIEKVFQMGAQYDLAVLGRYYGLRCAKGTYVDTCWCHHASYPYLRKSLEVQTSMYTWEPYYKDEGRVQFGKRTDEAQFNYNCKDCTVTQEIYPVAVRNAKELGMWKGYQRTLSILPSHLGMSLRGVRIDQEKQVKLGTEFKNKADEYRRLVCEETKMDINLNSSDQKQQLLYGYLGLEIQFNRKTKKATTDKDALNKLKRKYPHHKVLDWILKYQKFAKFASTYTSMKCDADGRMHTTYGLVSTWRMNSTASPFGGPDKKDREGGNLQNIPKKGEEGKLIRGLFIPDEGKVMLASDRRQAEAMVVAYESEDLEKIEMFKRGENVHWHNAKSLFDIPDSVPYNPTAIFKDRITNEDHTLKELYDIGKTVEYAGTYGMGPYKQQAIMAQEGFVVEYKVAKRLLEVFKMKRPHLQAWQHSIREELRATRTLISCLGRKRQFLGRFNADLFNAGYAFKPQNTVGELTELTIQGIWEELDYYDILLNAHDEVVGQCLPKDVPRAMEDITRLSKYDLIIKGRVLDIPVDFKVGPSWGELEEVG